MQLNIELVPHTGERQDDLLGTVEVEFDQYIIVAKSEQLTKATGRPLLELGYVGKKPGSPINFLPSANRFPENVQDAIAKSVVDKLVAMHTEDQVALELSKPRDVHHAIPPDVEVAIDAIANKSDSTVDVAGSEQNL